MKNIKYIGYCLLAASENWKVYFGFFDFSFRLNRFGTQPTHIFHFVSHDIFYTIALCHLYYLIALLAEKLSHID